MPLAPAPPGPRPAPSGDTASESDRTAPQEEAEGWGANREHAAAGSTAFCVSGKSSPNSFPKLQAPMGVPSPSEPCTGRSVPLLPRPEVGILTPT